MVYQFYHHSRNAETLDAPPSQLPFLSLTTM
jgi:hypothetical protein